MLTEEQKLIILQNVPFVPASQMKISDAVKGNDISENDLYFALSALAQEGKIHMNMGPKGPEFSRFWNQAIEEERKFVSRELNSRLPEGTIYLPRYEGYVANLDENFISNDLAYITASFGDLNVEYTKWHKNAKSGVIYPPKLNALNSASALACNLVQAMNLDPERVEYAVEFEVIAKEQMHDRPNEISAPKVQFEAIINYDESIEFLQTNFLERFYPPYRQSMWAYQYGSRYLFEDEDAIEKWRDFTKHANYVFFDGYQAIKTLIAIYSDILANVEDYQGKNVRVLNVNWNLGKDSKYANMKEYQDDLVAEAKRAEVKLNEFLSTLPLPEGTTLEYQFLTLEETIESLPEESKAFFTNRYLNF